MVKKNSISGTPDFSGLNNSLLAKLRRTSLVDPPKRHSLPLGGNDILFDALTVTQSINLGNHPDSAVENVRRVLSLNDDDEYSPVFSEMMRLKKTHKGFSWQQYARWIKYEQVVQGNGTRFSKPHITLLSVQGMMQVRNCLRKGVVILDSEAETIDRIFDEIINMWIERGFIAADLADSMRTVMGCQKRHFGTPCAAKETLNSKPEEETKTIKLVKTEDKMMKLVDSDEDESENDSLVESYISRIAQSNERLLHKLPHGTESCSILIGEVSFLERPVSCFMRLKTAQNLFPDLPDIPVPTRFIFIVLSLAENYERENINIGKTMGALMADEIFRKVAQVTQDPHTLSDAVEEFFSQVVAIPPSKCTTETRWEPREVTAQERRTIGMLYATYDSDVDDDSPPSSQHVDITRTGKLFGGLRQDIKTKLPWFRSDFGDFFNERLSQSLAATVFLFFANITSIITFGAVMERALHHQMAAMEAIICGGISGLLFAMFSGQPLNILSATGPTLVFEKILFEFCVTNGWEFLPFRVWVGVWIAVMLIILTATDMSALVGLITRFTEEVFATLISVVFIISAFQKLLQISHDAPIIADPREVYESPCYCHFEETVPGSNFTVKLKLTNLTALECNSRGGEAIGLQCHFKPDVYMLSVLLTFGTFALAYAFNHFRKSAFLPSALRNSISDFGVLIAIVLMTGLSHFIGLDVPSLNVPDQLRPTLDRNWLVDPTSNPPMVILIAILPAIFYSILIVMDQQITAVIINRKDNNLRKGHGYHLDLLVIAILVLVCSILGLPYFVAATVLSVMHVDALRLRSESSAPGEKPQFLGVKEQRLTGILAHLLIGLSVFLTSIIKMVPLPVLIGIFLYMGVVSLLGQQFVQRIALLFMPVKHQPDHSWLRSVGMKRVHLFTVFQILCIVALFAVKYMKPISMVFPMMLVLMVVVRIFILEKIFTKAELLALDDPVPPVSAVLRPIEERKKSLRVPDVPKLDSLTEKDNKTELLLHA